MTVQIILHIVLIELPKGRRFSLSIRIRLCGGSGGGIHRKNILCRDRSQRQRRERKRGGRRSRTPMLQIRRRTQVQPSRSLIICVATREQRQPCLSCSPASSTAAASEERRSWEAGVVCCLATTGFVVDATEGCRVFQLGSLLGVSPPPCASVHAHASTCSLRCSPLKTYTIEKVCGGMYR